MSRSKRSLSDRSESGSDFLSLDMCAAPTGHMTDWLTEQLREAIADGQLPVGSRLPPSRVLAGELRVSRGVVTEAYQRLAEAGRVVGRGRAGTVVLASPVVTTARPPSREPVPTDATPLFPRAPDADDTERVRASPARLDLSPGVPALTSFPRSEWLRAERVVLKRLTGDDLRYGDPSGAWVFRLAITRWIARHRGVRAEPADVIVTTGVAQALALLVDVLREEGVTAIAVEDPGSWGTRQHLQEGGVRTPPVPVDDQGIRVDALASSGAEAVLLTPAHQFPMGVVLDRSRRRDLVEWAASGGLVIEDDYDAEHRYDRPPVPALHALLPDQVCYAGSVSKTLAPALRIGWLIVPERYRRAVVAAKRHADLGTTVLPQLVLAELMESGALERHLRLVRRRHRERRDATIDALRQHLPLARVHGAAAGLHLTVTLPDGVEDTALATTALERGVKVHPLSWHRHGSGQPGLVLGYAACTRDEVRQAIAHLGELCR